MIPAACPFDPCAVAGFRRRCGTRGPGIAMRAELPGSRFGAPQSED